jgi:large subunit ribosomal protein L35
MASQKMKSHKGIKKRFKVTATGKVSHKRCGSSHLNSHKSGSKIRKLRKKSYLKLKGLSRRIRIQVLVRNPRPPALPEAESEITTRVDEQPGVGHEA